MQNRVSKDQWIAMFREIGLTEEQMSEWHRLFEERHPEGHAGFLAWLGISETEIGEIRSRCH